MTAITALRKFRNASLSRRSRLGHVTSLEGSCKSPSPTPPASYNSGSGTGTSTPPMPTGTSVASERPSPGPGLPPPPATRCGSPRNCGPLNTRSGRPRRPLSRCWNASAPTTSTCCSGTKNSATTSVPGRTWNAPSKTAGCVPSDCRISSHRAPKRSSAPPAFPIRAAQVECHPYHQQNDLKKRLAPYGTALESWFPLSPGDPSLLKRNPPSSPSTNATASPRRRSPFEGTFRRGPSCSRSPRRLNT